MEPFLESKKFFNKTKKQIKSSLQQFSYQLGQNYIAGNTLQETLIKAKNFQEKGFLVNLNIRTHPIPKYKKLQACKLLLESMIEANLKAQTTFFIEDLGATSKSKLTSSLDELIAFCKIKNAYLFLGTKLEKYQQFLIDYGSHNKLSRTHFSIILPAQARRTPLDLLQLLNDKISICLFDDSTELKNENSFKQNRVFESFIPKLLASDLEHSFFTHDARVIETVLKHAKKLDTPKELFSFHIQFGLATKQAFSLLTKGYQIQLHLSFGQKWPKVAKRQLIQEVNLQKNLVLEKLDKLVRFS